MRKLSDNELNEVEGGEAITITAIMAVLAVALVAVICYRLFMSSKGGATLPGGFKFTWD
ncbi:MAG: bacteriocin [Erysipelotrichales bacterium]|nr:bacteriocin [Erysipelotrichales bacterium]